jgi:maltose O-acetyltransferase
MSARSEQDKMLSGETYNCLDADLLALRQEISPLLWRHNHTEPEGERRNILQQLLGSLGRDSIVEPPFYCVYGRNIHIGEKTYLNVMCTMVDCSEIHIGSHVMIGPSVQIYTAAHALQAEARSEDWRSPAPS